MPMAGRLYVKAVPVVGEEEEEGFARATWWNR
jgi:hypothetical protein